MYKIGLAVTLVMALGVATTANAGNSWGKNYKNQQYSQENGKFDARIEIRFSNYDRELINQYYSYGKQKGLPPGLAKKGKLPPGLQKQIVRNGQLPPGLQAKYLPYELERRLPRLSQNYVRLRVGTEIVLMDIPTKIILDVIKDISL